MNALWRIELLGGLCVRQAERTIARFRTQKAGALLAYLAYFPHKVHSREVLLDLFWPELDAYAGRDNLSTVLSSLRHQLEPPGVPSGAVLIADRLSVRVNPNAISTDVAEFEALLSLAERAQSETERAQCLQDALALYVGPLLPGYYEEWLRTERERLAEVYLQAVRQLLRHLAQSGELPRAIDYAQQAVRMEPLRETAHRDLIQLYVASGQASAALQQYRTLEALLQQELGERPTAAARQLLQQIQRQEQGTDPAEPPAPVRARTRKAEKPQRLKERVVSRIEAAPVPPPGGTVTFLLADLVRMTAAHERAEETFTEALASIAAPLRRDFQRHRGFLFKQTSDSFQVAFPSALDALACAIAVSLSPFPFHLKVRMALHTGEVAAETGDYQGLALNQALRLLTAGHGGQILCSEATATLLRRHLESGVRLKDLGIYRLREMPAPEPFYQIEHPDLPEYVYPPLQAAAGYAASLPQQFTCFFGREDELARLSQLLLLPQTRLVTLTGAGGIGKTRLATEAAKRLVEAFAGAVWFVSLADIEDANLISSALVDALRLPHTARVEPLEQAVEALSRQPSLLVLDNFEQLVARGALLLRALLERVPALKCLVTSRQRLELEGEHEFMVSPLQTPQSAGTPEQLCLYESVQLFLDRAQIVKPDFQVTANNAVEVGRLSTQLEGLPLAIELAAARVQVLTPAQMLSQLAQRFDLLVSRRRDVAERHRTLRAAIDWSYRLLSPELQRCFARLSAFRGGWTLDAAEFVCSTDEGVQVFRSSGVQEMQAPTLADEVQLTAVSSASEPEYLNTRIPEHLNADTLDLLAQLRECSLILSETSGEEMRFRMLETLREYAWERLQQSGENESMRQRHSDYFLALAEQADRHLQGPDQAHWLECLDREHDNLRAALEGCLEGRGEEGEKGRRGEEKRANQSKIENRKSKISESGLRLAGALGWFWHVRGYVSEGRAYLAAALQRDGAAGRTQARVKALNGAALLASDQGEYDAARTLYEQSLAIARELGNRSGIAAALNGLGNVAWAQGDHGKARVRLEESLALQRELGNKPGIAAALNNLGNVAKIQSDYEASRAFHQQGLAIRRELGARQGIANSLNNLGVLAYEQGDYEAAWSLLEESLALQQEIGDKQGSALSLDNLGNIAKDRGDYRAARPLLEQSLALRRELGDKRGIASSLNNLGLMAYHQGDHEAATSLFKQSLATRRELGDKQGMAIALVNLGPLVCEGNDYAAAQSYLTECLALLKEIQDKRVLAFALEGCAQLAQHRRRAKREVRLWGAAEALREAIGSPLPANEREEYDRFLAVAREKLGEVMFAALWAEGRAMTPEQAIDYALTDR